MSKSPSLRRIQADIRELALDPSDQYHASPLENDMFEWHFTIRGAKGTDFEGGIYHGRILLPPEYPFKPPHIMFLTPSGRFETNTKVCLSFSAYHPELWQPAWGIRLILEALISFLPTPADGAIGALDWSTKERQRLAKKSCEWCCPQCGSIACLIPSKKKNTSQEESANENEAATSAKPSRFAKEIQELQRLQMMEHKKNEPDKEDKKESNKKQGEKETDETKPKTPEAAKQEDSQSEKDPGQLEETIAPGLSNANAEGDAAVVAEHQETVPSSQRVNETTAPNTAPAPVRPAPVAPQQRTSGMWWLLDPLLQLIILVLSAICYLLLRKVHDLSVDLQALLEE